MAHYIIVGSIMLFITLAVALTTWFTRDLDRRPNMEAPQQHKQD